jgi:hypothetical protein
MNHAVDIVNVDVEANPRQQPKAQRERHYNQHACSDCVFHSSPLSHGTESEFCTLNSIRTEIVALQVSKYQLRGPAPNRGYLAGSDSVEMSVIVCFQLNEQICWYVSRELLEIVDQVHLVEVSEVMSDICP